MLYMKIYSTLPPQGYVLSFSQCYSAFSLPLKSHDISSYFLMKTVIISNRAY